MSSRTQKEMYKNELAKVWELIYEERQRCTKLEKSVEALLLEKDRLSVALSEQALYFREREAQLYMQLCAKKDSMKMQIRAKQGDWLRQLSQALQLDFKQLQKQLNTRQDHQSTALLSDTHRQYSTNMESASVGNDNATGIQASKSNSIARTFNHLVTLIASLQESQNAASLSTSRKRSSRQIASSYPLAMASWAPGTTSVVLSSLAAKHKSNCKLSLDKNEASQRSYKIGSRRRRMTVFAIDQSVEPRHHDKSTGGLAKGRAGDLEKQWKKLEEAERALDATKGAADFYIASPSSAAKRFISVPEQKQSPVEPISFGYGMTKSSGSAEKFELQARLLANSNRKENEQTKNENN
eukprot:CAMPEP_0185596506 /NCGR_PEP_ID=MMETSP0434-20130131/80799_1 /TAXON_ID=626734 ORGANISM="Favella taraikaensis, Strain Fe Narragansett Bay" /NCGR_SAMPLE_ID=MMETSP0434 /ASSEMBLY_ACC=CAM_ASM_000379 /LENGTH=353 /DNA_ID=CAMNT_0028225021 /DNA_START=1422 /DNA_END=2483 /DNA_ORIENTATION=-